MANPNWQSTWTAADVAELVRKRDEERKSFVQIGVEMARPKSSCKRIYYGVQNNRCERAPSTVPEPQRPERLHVELGIETFEHLQAVTDYVGGYDKDTGQYFSPHAYRAKVTLAKVFA